MNATLLAHHIGIEIMGHEFEPHGFWQHAVAFTGSLILLALAAIGLVTVFRWIAARRDEKVRETVE